MTEIRRRQILGVVGGMGPLASAEFLKTIYEYALGPREQDSPVVMVYSDPTFPDRTDAFLSGSCESVLGRLVQALNHLNTLGASRIVLCCMTIHYLLPRLPHPLRRPIVSLLDVIYARLARTEKRHLLICSTGTRRLELFESHSQWRRFQHRIVLPDGCDQNMIHKDLIYPIKQNPDLRRVTPILERLLAKYNVDSFIAGCSEIHLLAKYFSVSENNTKGYSCVDPLTIIAQELAEECS